MDTRITILATQDKNSVTDIRLTAERDYKPIFSEAFSTTSTLTGIHLTGTRDIMCEDAADSGSRKVLSELLELISGGLKTDGHVYTDNEIELKSQIKDYPVIKRFEEIVGVSFDWSKFNNAQEFRTYFQRLINKEF